jgi:hypothetical protein
MKVLAATLSVILLASACGREDGPGDAVLGMFEALRDGDGALVVGYMSSGALEELGNRLDTLKTDPETASAQLALMGIRIDAAEIPGMTAAQFAEILFSSPMITGITASGDVSVGEVTHHGDSATVEVTSTFTGEPSTHLVELVLEDGAWKVTNPLNQ